MSRLQILRGGFLVFKKIVRRFDGIRAVTELRDTAPRMDGHRLSDGLGACDAPDIGQLCPCKLFFCPSLGGVVHTTLQYHYSFSLVGKTMIVYHVLPRVLGNDKQLTVVTSTRA